MVAAGPGLSVPVGQTFEPCVRLIVLAAKALWFVSKEGTQIIHVDTALDSPEKVPV